MRLSHPTPHLTAACQRACPSIHARASRRCDPCCSSSRPDAGAGGAGDEKVQDALVDVLNAGIQRSRMKDKLDEGVDAEREKLIQTAEEMHEEIRKIQELNKARSDLAFGSTLADIDVKYRDFEKKLKESRARLEADQADFEQFQRKVIRDRSQGLMFGELYRDKELDAKARRQRGISDSYTRMEMKARAEAAQKAARTKLKNPARPLLFGILAAVLVGACILDVAEGSPSWPQIGIYAVIAVSLVSTALQERTFLISEASDDDAS